MMVDPSALLPVPDSAPPSSDSHEETASTSDLMCTPFGLALVPNDDERYPAEEGDPSSTSRPPPAADEDP